MEKKLIKESNKDWKPKRKWIESTTIDLKTGKSKHKYFIPKTPEEEKKLEYEFDEKMRQVFDILFPNGI
jgi:hypothetical protein